MRKKGPARFCFKKLFLIIREILQRNRSRHFSLQFVNSRLSTVYLNNVFVNNFRSSVVKRKIIFFALGEYEGQRRGG